jgi:ornithine carbamoyltransferase
MPAPRHFLDLDRVSSDDLKRILAYGAAYKKGDSPTDSPAPMAGRTLALVFEKPSTRTRVSFEVGMQEMGGNVVVLQGAECQLGRGETVGDTARVLSRYVDAVMIRTDAPWKLEEMAANAAVPVINGLTDDSHPCQIMADVMTFEEHRGPIAGRRVAWSGDGNNVATSWIHAAAAFGFELRLACPEALSPSEEAVARARQRGAAVSVVRDPAEAADGADCVVTDTWVSMGDDQADSRHALLEPFQVNEALMARAKPDAVFMHCLPAHRGEEVTAGVIDGPWSVVWDEAENRLHAQKGILTWCFER